ncbi:hypothetical protein OG559_15220 [Micromonospora sp. NBC_01405]|uniref:hypothetical protein n=1 Tax=Micromonospora sp. NBC_01405 TaxID=2903589 RepID=UPI003252E74E
MKKYLEARAVVESVEELDDFRLVVRRRGMSDVRVYLTSSYEVGVADVEEILSEAPETTCIVSTMDYNHYSSEAKTLAAGRCVGLFKSVEFLGAVYFDGEAFLGYLSPAEREALRRRNNS